MNIFDANIILQVKPYDIVNLVIYPNDGKENEDLEIFVTEPGEEYYVHMYLWRTNPFSFKLDSKVEAVDLTLKKIESHRDTDCNAGDDYDYIGKQFLKCFIPDDNFSLIILVHFQM